MQFVTPNPIMKTVNPLTYMIDSPTTCFTDEEHAQELLEELLEDGHDVDEMKGFIEIYFSKMK